MANILPEDHPSSASLPPQEEKHYDGGLLATAKMRALMAAVSALLLILLLFALIGYVQVISQKESRGLLADNLGPAVNLLPGYDRFGEELEPQQGGIGKAETPFIEPGGGVLELAADTTIQEGLTVAKALTVNGEITAPNLLYGLVAGEGIAVSDGQRPTVSITSVGIGSGGTGITSYTKGDVLYASEANTLSKLSVGSTGQVLTVSSSGVPNWSNQTASSGDITAISAGSGLSGGASSGDASLAIALPSSGTGSATSSNSGMEVGSFGLSLLRGCSSSQILKWDGSNWICSADSGGAGSSTLQDGYTNTAGGTAEIVLDSTRGALTIRDASTPIGANLLEVQNNAGSTTYLAVTTSGVTASSLTSSSGLTVSAGSVSLPAGQIDNSELANSSLTVTAGTGLSGGGAVSLGGSTTLSIDQSFTPTWTGAHIFSSSVTLSGAISANDASADSILIGQSGATDDTVTIAGDISLTDDQWSISATGAASGLSGTNTSFTSGDLSCTDCIGPTEITDLALGTDTAGNYVLSVSAGSGLAVSGAAGEGWTPTIALGALTADWNQTGAFDIQLNNSSSELKILESGATPSLYGILDVGDLSSSDATYTFSGGSGTVYTSANDPFDTAAEIQGVSVGGDLSGTIGTATIAANAVALSTDTTGDYVASITAGSGISSSGAASGENISHTLSLGALTADWNQTGAFDIQLNNSSSEVKILESGGSPTLFGIFDIADLSTADKTYTFPDITGTVALLEGSQTFSGAKTFDAGLIANSAANLGDGTGADNITLNRGSGNITLTGFTSCTALETNASAQLVCGSDDTGAGGGITTVKESDASPSYGSLTTLELGPASTSEDEFIVTNPSAGVARVVVGNQVAKLNETETVSATWTFSAGITADDASADSILIGQSGATDDTVTIAGDLSLTDDQWSISATGAASGLSGTNTSFTSGDLSCTDCIGPTEITDLTLGTDTAGNYVATVTGGSGLTGLGNTEGSTPTLAVGAGTGITVNADDVAVNQDYSFAWTNSHSYTFLGTENLGLSSDLAGTVNLLSVTGTPSATAGTTRGVFIQQANHASNTNGLDAGLVIDNADADLAITAGIQILNSGGGAYTNYISAPNFVVSNAGAITTGSIPWGSVTSQPNIVSSLEGVTNDEGNIDLIGSGVTITGDDGANTITFTVATGAGANIFSTIDAPAGTDPVADSVTDTLALTVTGTNLTLTGNSTTDTIDFDISESTLAGNGLAANSSALDVGLNGASLEIVSDGLRINLANSNTWTASQALNGGLSAAQTLTADGSSVGSITPTSNLSATGTINGLTITPTRGGSAAANTYTINALQLAAVAGSCPSGGATCVQNALFVPSSAGYTDILKVGSTSVVNGSGQLNLGSVTGTLAVGNGGTGATTLNDLITLTTHTTGNYVATVTGGGGLTGLGNTEGSTPTLAVGAGTGITVNADDVAVNQDTAFSWTNAHTFTLAETEDLQLDISISGTNSGQGEIITLTNSSSSGSQYGLYIDNAASSGTTESLLVLDNSDSDTAVTNAIEFVNAGGSFTSLFNVAGTTISITEFTALDNGIETGDIANGTITGDDVAASLAGDGLTLDTAAAPDEIDVSVSNGLEISSDAVRVNQNYSFSWTADHTYTLAGSEDIAISHDLAGAINVVSITGTAQASANTAYGLYIDQANNATDNVGFDASLVIDNSDTAGAAIADGILFVDAGSGFTDFLDTPSSVFKVTGAGVLTAAGGTFNGNVNMTSDLLLNIGDSGTDFTAGGGLTLAANADLTLTSGSGSVVVNSSVTNVSDQVLDLNPSYTGGATDSLTYNVIDIAAFSPTNAAGTDSVNAISIGNLTDPGATISSNALSFGTGWDSDINATTSLEVGIGGVNELVLSATSLTPNAAEGNSLGSSSLEWEEVFLGDDAGIKFGLDQDFSLYYDNATDARLELTDGTNLMVAIKDQGAYGFLTINGKTDTGDPTCAAASEGSVYYNAADDTIKLCNGSSWEALDGGGGSLFTAHASGFTYLTDTDDDFVLGGSTIAGASLYFDESAGNLKLGTDAVLDGVLTLYSSGASETDPTISAESDGDLTLSAPTGTVNVGSGSGNITMSLSQQADLFSATKTVALSSAYSSNDYTYTRSLSSDTAAKTQGGAVFKITDTSSSSAATTINPDMLLINAAVTGSTAFSGNLINAQLSGATKFRVSSTGALFLGSDEITDGSITLYSSGSPETDPTIVAESDGDLTLSAPTGAINIGSTLNCTDCINADDLADNLDLTAASETSLTFTTAASNTVVLQQPTAAGGLVDINISTSTSNVRGLDSSFTFTGTATGNTAYGTYSALTSTQALGNVSQDLYGIYGSVTKTGIDTSTSGTLSIYGVYGIASNTQASGSPTGTRNTYGGYFSATGDTENTSTAIGLYATASGADNNYAGIFDAGNVGIGDTTPAAALTVGANDIYQIASTGLVDVSPTTTGTLINYNLETEWTSGTLLRADFASSTTQTGNITGIDFDLSPNLTPLTGAASNLTGYRFQTPAVTETGAFNHIYRGFYIQDPGAITNQSTGTFDFLGIDLTTPGALTQNTAAGTIGWRGIRIIAPNLTQTTGNVYTIGVNVGTGTITTGGSQTAFSADLSGSTITTGGNIFGLDIAAPSAGVGAGGLLGIRIGGITTPGSGTETGIEINSGWDMAIDVADNALIGFSTSGARIEFDDQTTDEINFLNAYVAIGDTTPTYPLSIESDNPWILMQNPNMTWGSTGTIGSLYWTYNAGDDAALIKIERQTANAFSNEMQFHIERDSDGNTGAVMTLEASGEVGIGTTDPSFRLSVVNNVASQVARITNLRTNDETGGRGLNIAIGTATTGTQVRFMQFLAGATTESNGSGVGAIQLNNGGVSYGSGGGDFAEYMDVTEGTTHGDIIAATSAGNAKSRGEGTLIGVVSDTFAFLGNQKTDNPLPNQAVVGLIGQVKTKVTTLNGPIRKGDAVTSSSIAGFGKKALRAGAIIGKALEDFDPAKGQGEALACPSGAPEGLVCGKVMLYVNAGYADPENVLASLTLDSQGKLIIPDFGSSSIQLDGKLTIGGKEVSGSLDTALLAMGEYISSVDLQTAARLDTVEDRVRALEEKEASSSAALAQAQQVASQALAQTNVLSESVASTSADLANLSSQIDQLLAGMGLSEASSSGTVAAASDLKLTSPDTLLAPESAQLADLKVGNQLSTLKLNASEAIVTDAFKSLGDTFLGRTTIAGDLSVDGTMALTGDSISVVGTLRLQSGPLAEFIDLFNGAVAIDKSGNIATLGDFTSQGTISGQKVEGQTIEGVRIEAQKVGVGSGSLGSGLLPAGQKTITISSDQVGNSSAVFVTATSSTGGQALVVSNKQPGKGFTVSIDNPVRADIDFDWWIVDRD